MCFHSRIYRRHNENITFHEEIEGGPKSFDRLPMSTDSLTILTRIQQRKRLAVEQDNNNLIELGSGIRRLVTFEDHEENISFSLECEQDKIEKKSSSHVFLDGEDGNSMKTTSINTKSYNTSAHTKQKDLNKVFCFNFDLKKELSTYFQFQQVKQQRKNKRRSRSPAEYGKYRQKRKRHKQDESISKITNNNINPKHSFFNKLFLLSQNKKPKTIINRDRKEKHDKSSKAVNTNAITEDSNPTINTNHEDETFALKNSTSPQNNLFLQSAEDLLCEFPIDC